MSIRRQRILLTGVRTGIGRASALLLSSRGHEVLGTSRDPERAAEALDGWPPDLIRRLNLLQPHSVAELVDSLPWLPDVIIHNAGAGIFGRIEDVQEDEALQQWRLLMAAPLLLTQALLPAMRKRKAGVVVFITSMASEMAIPGLGYYGAAKAALSRAAEALRLELRGSGVRVVDVRPGDIRTPFNQAMQLAQRTAQCPDAWSEGVRKRLDDLINTAPSPQVVARALLRIVEGKDRRAVVRVGDPLQTFCASWAARVLPTQWWERCLADYYRLP